MEKKTSMMKQKINLDEFHSIKYLEMLKETTYKGKEVVFILPDGREI